MKRKFVLLLFVMVGFVGVSALIAQEVKHLTAEEFQKEIYDYKNNAEWAFNGDTPVLVDFYATWCGPCRKLAPVLKELQKEYGDKVKIYKVNVDKERELSGVFGVRSIPTLLFIPKEGKPYIANGALKKEALKEAFKEIFDI